MTIMFPEAEVPEELEELHQLSSKSLAEFDLIAVFKLLRSRPWPKITKEQDEEWGHARWWRAEELADFQCKNFSGYHSGYYGHCRTWAEQPVSDWQIGRAHV